jgi:hypothetical protein
LTKRSLQLLSAAALLMTGLGCSDPQDDRTEAESAPPESPAVSVSAEAIPSEPSTDPGDSRLAALRPCELLTAGEQSQLSLRTSIDRRDSNFPNCLWKGTDRQIVVTIVTQFGLDVYRDEPGSERLTVNSRPAVRSTRGGSCNIGLEITGSSRVDVNGTIDTGLDGACKIAWQAAQMVEPKLPAAADR